MQLFPEAMSGTQALPPPAQMPLDHFASRTQTVNPRCTSVGVLWNQDTERTLGFYLLLEDCSLGDTPYSLLLSNTFSTKED